MEPTGKDSRKEVLQQKVREDSFTRAVTDGIQGVERSGVWCANERDPVALHCSQGSPIVVACDKIFFFLKPENIPLCVYTFSLSTHLLIGYCE